MIDILKLTVTLGDRVVGTLQMTPQRNRCVFEYDKAWLSDGFSISPWELPLQPGLIYSREDSFRGGFAAFEDSMPDGYGLYLLDRMLRKDGTSLSALTPLQRLSLVGKAGHGALCYIPEFKHELTQSVSENEFDALQQKALDVLGEKSDADVSLLYYNSGNSGGARPKAVFQAQDGSSWIVKFRHIYDPVNMGQMEYHYMSTAEKCGIQIPEIRLVKNKYFAIKRFDVATNRRRLHTLTAAALLQKDYGIQNVDYINLLALTGYLTQDPLQVEQMFRRMVFNVVCVNKDDHAKNFSFTCDNGRWALAPAYDITYSPEGTRGEHATSVKYSGNPTRDDLVAAGTGIHIRESRCNEIIDEIIEICKAELDVDLLLLP